MMDLEDARETIEHLNVVIGDKVLPLSAHLLQMGLNRSPTTASLSACVSDGLK